MILHIVCDVPFSSAFHVHLRAVKANLKWKQKSEVSELKDATVKVSRPTRGGRSTRQTVIREVSASITGDGDSEYEGGISDCDERNGEEGRLASESPMKGKQRVNSSVSLQRSLLLCFINLITNSLFY
jgi:hypothetical protein